MTLHAEEPAARVAFRFSFRRSRFGRLREVTLPSVFLKPHSLGYYVKD